MDVNFKINLPTQRFGKFALFGIGGISYAGEKAERDTTLWKERWDRFGETEKQHRGVLGLSHRYNFKNQKTYWKNVVAVTYEGTLLQSDSINKTAQLTEVQRVKSGYTNVRWASTLNHKFNSRHILRTGFIFSNLGYSNYRKDFDFETRTINLTTDTKGSTQLLQAFAQWQFRANEKLTFNVGGHYTQNFINQDQSIEPRLGAQWQINSQHSLSFGAGMHTRALPTSVYLNKIKMADGTWQESNRDLKMTKAVHQALGHDWRISDNWRLKTEVYYQYLYNLAVDVNGYEAVTNTSGGTWDLDFVNTGKGKNYGAEFTLEKFLSKGYYALVTASLFDSRYQDAQGVWRNTPFNSRYVMNVVGGKEFKVGREKQNILGFNTRMMWRGGLYRTPVDLTKSLETQATVRDKNNPYTVKISDYFRIDFSASYRINRPKVSWSINAEVQNLTNRLNEFGQYFDTKTQAIKTYTYTGLLPNLNVRLDF